ncbi:O-antigen ligase family protein [Acinetobacter venetianus]|nr:O-antigen ligase family protein [Acinetobacter venetianus]
MSYQTNFYSSSNVIVLLLLSFLTIAISLVGLSYEPLVVLARGMTYSLTGFLILCYLYRGGFNVKIEKSLFFFFLLVCWVGVRAKNIYGLGLFLQTILLFLSAFVLRNLNFSFKVDKAILIGAFFYTLMAFIHFFVTPIFANSNYIGVCGLIFLVIFFSKQTKFFYIFSLMCLGFIVLSGTRSAILGLVVGYFLFKIFNLQKALRYLSLFFLIVITILFFKSGLYDYLNSEDFAQLVIDKTGKRLESGRFEIWELIFSNMSFSNYIVGLGGGTDYEAIIGSKLSAHSGYVYIISSYGIVGLFLFAMASIFSIIRLFKEGYYFSFLLFVALLFREFFEVTLLHNSFPIALFFWAFLSNGYLDQLRLSRLSSGTVKD